MSYLKLETKDLERANTLLKAVKKDINKVLVRSLNRTAQMAKTSQNRLIRQGYNVPAQEVRTRISLRKSSVSNLEAVILNRTGRVSLSKFKVSKQTPGHYKENLKIAVKKGSLKDLKGAFWANYKNNTDKMGLYVRTGRERSSLEKLYGPSVYQMGTTEENKEIILKEANENLKKRIEHEILRELKIK